jgi:hypothetical protein
MATIVSGYDPSFISEIVSSRIMWRGTVADGGWEEVVTYRIPKHMTESLFLFESLGDVVRLTPEMKADFTMVHNSVNFTYIDNHSHMFALWNLEGIEIIEIGAGRMESTLEEWEHYNKHARYGMYYEIEI